MFALSHIAWYRCFFCFFSPPLITKNEVTTSTTGMLFPEAIQSHHPVLLGATIHILLGNSGLDL